ncbi:Cyclin-like [Sesbania bispinosa]|nr:Cyclin-like [Sesbania bispinosa]
MEFDLENPLENFHDLDCDAVSSLFLIESDHIPPQNYFQTLKARDLDISARREVISLISQLSCTLDPVLSYLAINYLDRFLANQGLLQTKPWVLRLLAVSCFSLAAKMMRTEYSATDVQALLEQSKGGIIFEAQTIQRMEALILGALQWRMRSITPFSFITFFINLFSLKDPHTGKENMLRCYNVIQDIATEEQNESVLNAVSSSDTPVNVLDHHFLSSESEITNGITVDASSPQRQEKDLKRRKITGCGNNPTTQNSLIKPC